MPFTPKQNESRLCTVLNLDSSTLNRLRSMGVHTPKDLLQQTYEDLAKRLSLRQMNLIDGELTRFGHQLAAAPKKDQVA